MKVKFTDVKYPDKLELRYIKDDEWELLREFRCFFNANYGMVTHPQVITVPAGFCNDLSSVPQIFQNIVPVVGPQNHPSVIHDWCYEHRWRTREESDDLFLAGLISCKVSFFRRNLMYTAVRIGGEHAWRT